MSSPGIYHDYDPYLLLTGVPHRLGFSPEYGHYRLNALGFRSAEIAEKRCYRIAVVGGSTVWGSGASDDKATCPAQLARCLKEEYGLSAEVINAGVGSYFSFQELVLIAHRVVYLAPDLVILLNGYNDINYSARIAEDEYVYNEIQTYQALKGFLLESTRGKEFANLGPLHRDVVRLLQRLVGGGVAGRALRGLRDLLAGYGGERAIPSGLRGETYRVNRKGIRNYLTNVEMAVDLLRGRRVDVLVTLQPYLPLSRKLRTPEEEAFLSEERAKQGKIETFAFMYREFERALREIAEAKTVEVHSLLDVFDAEGGQCFADYVHPNDQGYRLIAQRLARLIAPRVCPVEGAV